MADQITVINPQGVEGTIPVDQLSDAVSQGYSIVQNQVKVINPQGVEGTIPASQLADASSQGYTPIDESDKQHIKKVNEELAKIEKEGRFTHLPDPSAEHVKDDIFGKPIGDEKTYKMIDGSGKQVDIPVTKREEALSAGMKFADPNFQTLYEAYVEKARHRTVEEGPVGAFIRRNASSLSMGADKAMMDYLLTGENRDFVAQNLATEHLANQNALRYPIAGAAGTLAGIAGPVVGTGGSGLFGELKAGSEAGEAIRAGLAGTESGLARNAIARATGLAAEGAIISTPSAIAQAVIDKDPKASAEAVALGAGLNVLLGGAGRVVGKPLEALVGMKPTAIDAFLSESGLPQETISKLGTPEQKEGLVKLLLANGLKEDSSAQSIEKVLQDAAEGNHTQTTLSKLDPYLEDRLTVDKMQLKIAAIGEQALKLENIKLTLPGVEGVEKSAISPLIEDFSSKLKALGDEKGNISLPKLQEFAKEVGSDINWKEKAETTNLTNEFKKSVQQEVVKEVTRAADDAARIAGPKVAADWAADKYGIEVSKQLHTEFVSRVKVAGDKEGAGDNIINAIRGIVKHKAMKLVGGGLGAALGSAVGHPVMGAIAGTAVAEKALGPAADKILDHTQEFVTHYVNNPENKSTALKWLANKANSPAISSYLVLDAAHNTLKEMDKIPDFFRQIGVKGGVTFAQTSDPIRQLLGARANGLSKDQQFKELSGQITMMAGNPGLRNQHLAQMAAPFAIDHPQLAMELKNNLDKKIQFLSTILPKNPNPPQPFSKQDNWKPSKADLDEFHSQLRIAMNPFTLLDNMKNGTVTEKQVATAGVLNPNILTAIRDKIYEMAYSGKVDLTYQQKLNASLILGAAMHSSLENVAQLQSIYGAAQAPANIGSAAPPKRRGGGGSRIRADKLPSSKETLNQRLMGK